MGEKGKGEIKGMGKTENQENGKKEKRWIQEKFQNKYSKNGKNRKEKV